MRSLACSEYAPAADAEVPIRVLMHGLSGPVTVKGTEYNDVMPQYGTGIEMTDEEVAAVLTHVRSSWGNGAGHVTPEDVARVRAAERKATSPATAEELDALMKCAAPRGNRTDARRARRVVTIPCRATRSPRGSGARPRAAAP